MKSGIEKEYFSWICGLVCQRHKNYQRLMSTLYDTDFVYILPMDANRAADGVDLRYRFGSECSYPKSVIESRLDIRGCSVLEMMIALAIRCEEHIMNDPDIGDRTEKWFWNMMETLGLSNMTNDCFDEHYIKKVLNRFMKREYKRNGEGGLFCLKRSPQKTDLRKVEIWYQMMGYINEII